MSRRRPNRAPQNAHGPASASSDDDVPIAQLHPPRRVRPGQRLTDQSIGQAVEALEDMRERQHAKRRRYLNCDCVYLFALYVCSLVKLAKMCI